ncbi:MAG: ferrous iron transport protein B, partial [Candidatus Aminicenantes bacterium]|nr:ferrous iron transport protein B [Candidatus Aminicenantes bacterium]NIQ69885.1 ferrous iron transport protein B [Candidatus Aminicenantes bacterium]
MITVGLAGNPNVGKTTILNRIAGKNLKVGNWAGVTVEKSEVFFKFNNHDFHIIDLPGIYDLNATTDAERVAVDS